MTCAGWASEENESGLGLLGRPPFEEGQPAEESDRYLVRGSTKPQAGNSMRNFVYQNGQQHDCCEYRHVSKSLGLLSHQYEKSGKHRQRPEVGCDFEFNPASYR
jgi:hypothetical protein